MLHTTGLVDTDALGHQTVFLRPGDWVFGQGPARVSTLLGSCVSVLLWSPALRVGGACHCLLADRPPGRGGPALDGRYAHDAMLWLGQQLRQCGLGWGDVATTLVGGAGGEIGRANVAWMQAWVVEQGLRLQQVDVGGVVVRRVAFNLGSGEVTVAHGGRVSPLEVAS